jgi:polysaccharide export outer membrane protein
MLKRSSLTRSLMVRLIVLLAALPLLLAGTHASDAQSRSRNSRAEVSPTDTGSDAQSYVLGAGDRVRIKVYGEADISGEYEIDNNGVVSIPLAGRLKAAGLTTRQFEKAVAAALSRGIVRDPRVSAEIATYRPFYILGEVKKAGEYPYKSGLTVLDAIASAGGYTYRANESKVVIRRAGSNVEETVSLNTPVPVYPGDNIRIPERYF